MAYQQQFCNWNMPMNTQIFGDSSALGQQNEYVSVLTQKINRTRKKAFTTIENRKMPRKQTAARRNRITHVPHSRMAMQSAATIQRLWFVYPKWLRVTTLSKRFTYLLSNLNILFVEFRRPSAPNWSGIYIPYFEGKLQLEDITFTAWRREFHLWINIHIPEG